MATKYANGKIVTNGLVLALDVSDRNSYPGSGATWRDLSGNNHSGSLVNGVSYDTYRGVTSFGFNASQQRYISTNFTLPQQSISSSFSINVWFAPEFQNDSLVAGYRSPSLVFYKITANKFEMYPGEIFLPSTLATWNNMCAVWDGATFGTNTNNMKYYYNTLSTPTLTTITSPPYLRNGSNPTFFSGNMPFYVGGDPTGNDYFQGYIALVQVYNRALSAAEVTQNYNALKRRFSIT
jgi:hypothetical protein